MLDSQTRTASILDEERHQSEELIRERELEVAAYVQRLPVQFRNAAIELEFPKVLFAIAAQCRSRYARNVLLTSLQPERSLPQLKRRFNQIAEMRQLIVSGDEPPFRESLDVDAILDKVSIEGSRIYEEEGVRLLRVLRSMRLQRSFFASKSALVPELWRLSVPLYDDRILELHLDSVFDETGNVKDSASGELASIRREMLQTSNAIRSKLSRLLEKYSGEGYLQEELVTQRDGRFVVPIKQEFKRKIGGLVHSVSHTGQTVFIEPAETLELNNELRSLEFAERREIDRILLDLTVRMREVAPDLHRSLDASASLEAVYAKARYAETLAAFEPAIVELSPRGPNQKHAGRIRLSNARHPLLLQRLGRAKVVPLSIELGQNDQTLVITGPNAGGKTVLIKTVGLLAFFAQTGLPIPADEESYIPIFDGIFVEIGDSQSLAEDLSTFSSHISALATIMKESTYSSLVLLDEIGGGTDPREGSAIAESILETATRIGMMTIATTHYGQLAAYAETAEGVQNGSMEFNRETLQPTFQFRAGVPGSSHAFEIADRFGLDKSIVERARALRGTETNRLEQLLESLDLIEADSRKKRMELERELGKARILRTEYERRNEEAEDVRRSARVVAKKEAAELLRKTNTFIENAIREAREAATAAHDGASGAHDGTSGARESAAPQKQIVKPEQEDLKAIRRRQEQERKKLLDEMSTAERRPSTGAKIQEGSSVTLLSNPGQVGEVLSVNSKAVEVQFGSMKMRVSAEQLEVVKGSEKRKALRQEVSQSTKYLAEVAQPRLDIRGKFGDEGVELAESFLAQARAHGLERVEIIHGIGTGALGKRIQTYLKTSPYVRSYRYGEPQEGGSGVSVIEIR